MAIIYHKAPSVELLPLSDEGGHTMQFHPRWCTTYPWLQYSQLNKGGYYIACGVFGGDKSGLGDHLVVKTNVQIQKRAPNCAGATVLAGIMRWLYRKWRSLLILYKTRRGLSTLCYKRKRSSRSRSTGAFLFQSLRPSSSADEISCPSVDIRMTVHWTSLFRVRPEGKSLQRYYVIEPREERSPSNASSPSLLARAPPPSTRPFRTS